MMYRKKFEMKVDQTSFERTAKMTQGQIPRDEQVEIFEEQHFDRQLMSNVCQRMIG